MSQGKESSSRLDDKKKINLKYIGLINTNGYNCFKISLVTDFHVDDDTLIASCKAIHIYIYMCVCVFLLLTEVVNFIES
jgi:hypothetical protein